MENHMRQHRLFSILICGILLCLPAPGRAGEGAHLKPGSQSTAKLDPHWLLSTDTALRKYRAHELLLIDVRPQTAFKSGHIPGALNMPLHTLKTKKFLRATPIVLLNEGFSMTPLVNECRELRETGFRVFVLTGGIVGWIDRKGPFEGNPHQVEALRMVSPRVYHQEKDSPHHLTVESSPEAPALDKKAAGHRYASLVLCTPNGDGYPEMRSELQKHDKRPVFYLEGGKSAYRTYLHRLALSRQPRNERMKSIGKCASCVNKDLD